MAIKKIHILYILLMFSVTIFAQETPSRTAASGIVVDAESGETLPFVQVYFLKSTTSKGMMAISRLATRQDIPCLPSK